MEENGIMPSVVENTINVGQPFATRPGTSGFFDPSNNLRVIVNSENGTIVTVIPGGP
jgi:filamentous hemagglutinin